MIVRTLTIAGLSLALSAGSVLAASKLSTRWVGEEAGRFFAAYGPPTGDMEQGSKMVYSWRGGYSSRKIAAVKNAKGKTTARARTDRLVCAVKLTVDKKYRIAKIDTVVDKPGINGGPTWCEQYLDAARN